MIDFCKKSLIYGLILSLATPAWAIDLNTKVKNTDRSLFNSNPGVNIKEGRGSIFGEFNLSGNALVVRNKTSGKIDPLVKDLMGFDIGGNYGVTSWFQMGVLLPIEMSSGEENKTYLNGPYFEAKFKLLENFALVPSYQLPSSSKINVKVDNQTLEVPMGPKNGTYGAKVVYQKGDLTSGYAVAGQLGYYSSPENKFQNIDQSSQILMGVSAGMPLTETINAIGEIYGTKMTDAFPLEISGMLNFKGEDINWQLGAGSGNLQGSGSNTYKVFVGLTYVFGGERSPSGTLLPQLKPRRSAPVTTPPSLNHHPYKPMIEDGVDEQNGPDVGEPGDSKDPVIPDVDHSEIFYPYGRNIASVKSGTKVKKAPYFATLPNGQKVKVFDGEITELPKDTKVQYMTEKGYQDLVKQMKNEMAQAAERNNEAAKPQVVSQESEIIPVTPITLEEVPTEMSVNPPVVQDDKTVPATPIKVEEKGETLNTSPMVVKEKTPEMADPLPLIQENPAPMAPLSKMNEESEEVKVVPVDLNALAKEQQKERETKPESTKSEVPQVTISIQQRQELKESISKDFDSLSLENINQDLQLSEQAKLEQAKITEEMARKEKAAAEAKAQAEAEAKAKALAEADKNYRENAPLAEQNNAAPGKAASEEDLKPVRLDRKNRKQIIIELPRIQRDAYVAGKPIPQLQPVPAAEGKSSSQMLEENSAVEESSGPSYGFGDE